MRDFLCSPNGMKICFAILFTLLVGCSSPNNSCPPPSGWVATVAPGAFVGTWTLGNSATPCTCKIINADTFLTGSVRNDSTREVLSLIPNGPFVITWDATSPCGYMYLHDFNVRDSSSLYGDTDEHGECWLSANADTLNYTTARGDSLLSISGVRE